MPSGAREAGVSSRLSLLLALAMPLAAGAGSGSGPNSGPGSGNGGGYVSHQLKQQGQDLHPNDLVSVIVQMDASVSADDAKTGRERDAEAWQASSA